MNEQKKNEINDFRGISFSRNLQNNYIYARLLFARKYEMKICVEVRLVTRLAVGAAVGKELKSNEGR